MREEMEIVSDVVLEPLLMVYFVLLKRVANLMELSNANL